MQIQWKLLLCLTAWILLIPFLVLPALFILSLMIWRALIDTFALWFHPDWRPIYPPDTATAARLLSSGVQKTKLDSVQRCSGNIGAIGSVQEQISIEELRQTIKRNLLDVRNETSSKSWKHWKLRVVPRQFLGFLYWAPVPEELNLNQHIWEYSPVEDTRFEDFAIDWISNGYGGRPLWEIVISRPKLGKFAGKTVIYIKMNHSLGDGQSLRLMMESLCNVEYAPEVTKMKFTWGQTLFQVAVFPWNLYKLLLLPRETKYSSQKLLGTVQLFNTVNLNTIKRASKSTGCSFRAVIVCTLSSAIRRLMLESIKVADLKESIGIGVALPALYYTRSFEFLANRGTACLFSYPLRRECPLDRLKVANRDLQENLQIGQHRLNLASSYLMHVLPATILNTDMMSDIPASIVASDMRFASTPLMLFGKYLFANETYGVMTLDAQTLGIFCTFSTVGDSVAVGLTSSKKMIANDEAAERFWDYFLEELDMLYQLSAKNSVPDKLRIGDSKC